MSCKCKQNLNLPGELWLITVVPGSLSIQFMRLLLKSRVAPKLPTWIPTSYILSAYPVYLGESLFFPSTISYPLKCGMYLPKRREALTLLSHLLITATATTSKSFGNVLAEAHYSSSPLPCLDLSTLCILGK